MHLSAHFRDSKLWLKTKAGACKRISEMQKLIDREVDDFTWVILERSKVDPSATPKHRPGWMCESEYLPVALLCDRNRHLAIALINRGIAVWKE